MDPQGYGSKQNSPKVFGKISHPCHIHHPPKHQAQETHVELQEPNALSFCRRFPRTNPRVAGPTAGEGGFN